MPASTVKAGPVTADADSAAALDMVRLLDRHGDLVVDQTYQRLLDDEQIRTAYRQLVLARRVDTEGSNLQRQGQLALWPPALGQEAAALGAVYGLRDSDMIFPSYRELAAGMARGWDPLHVFRAFRGVAHMAWDPQAHKFGLFSFVVGAQTLQATGYGMGITLDETDEVTLVFLGDGATSEGHVNEAFNFAAVFDAPVIFLVQNNQWAISVPTDRQFRGPLYKRGEGFGMDSVRVDGNDLLAVQSVVSRAAEKARAGRGPQFIEAYTYRLGAHTTADDPTRYRESDEEQQWAERDPLVRIESYLRRHTKTPQKFFDEVASAADALAVDIRAAVADLPSPVITDLYDNVLAEPSAALIAEREEVSAYLATLEAR